MNNENGSTMNMLLIIIVVLLVAFGVWFFMKNSGPAQEPADNNSIDVTIPLPEGDDTPDSGGQSGNGTTQ